jgi:hypothetical protein
MIGVWGIENLRLGRSLALPRENEVMVLGVRLGGSLALPRENEVMGLCVRLGRSLALPREDEVMGVGCSARQEPRPPEGGQGISVFRAW